MVNQIAVIFVRAGMRKRLTLFGLLGLYWMIFFSSSRLLFMVYHWGLTQTLSWQDIFTTLFLGLRMDAAMSAYWMIIPGLLLTASIVKDSSAFPTANHAFVALFVFISTTVIVFDAELYRHWGFRMDATPLHYAREKGA